MHSIPSLGLNPNWTRDSSGSFIPRLAITVLCAIVVWLNASAARSLVAQIPSVPGANGAAGATGNNPNVATTNAAWHFEYTLFQLLLEERGLTTVQTSEALVMPRDSLIVVATSSSYGGNLSAASMLEFVNRGGAVLLARETSELSHSLFPSTSHELGTFHRGPVSAMRLADRYANFADCVTVTDIDDPDNLLSGVNSIITNRSGWHVLPNPSPLQWHVLARMPASTLPTLSNGAALLSLGRSTNDRPGLLMVAADASLFSNGMLWHGDNAMLAVRVAELMSRGRKQLAFLANGRRQDSAMQRLAQQLQDEKAQQDLQIKPPEPSLERLLRLSNAIAHEVGSSNAINEALQRQPRSVSPRRYFNFLIILIGVLAILFVLWKLAQATSLPSLLMPRRRMRPAFEMMPGSSAGDYRNSASYLAREFCSQWTGSRQSSDWQQSLALLLIRLSKIDETDKRDLSRIVDIACRGCHERMTGENFKRFGQTIARLRSKQDAFRLVG